MDPNGGSRILNGSEWWTLQWKERSGPDLSARVLEKIGRKRKHGKFENPVSLTFALLAARLVPGATAPGSHRLFPWRICIRRQEVAAFLRPSVI